MPDDQPRDALDTEVTDVHIQSSLEEFPATDDACGGEDADRCQAYADSTGERCRHRPLAGLPYCSDHVHLLDEVDIIRHGLQALESGG